MANHYLERMYNTYVFLQQFDQWSLYKYLQKIYTNEELEEYGVYFSSFTIRWNEEEHRFSCVNFFTSLNEEEFVQLEMEIYYAVVCKQALEECEIFYYAVQLEHSHETSFKG